MRHALKSGGVTLAVSNQLEEAGQPGLGLYNDFR